MSSGASGTRTPAAPPALDPQRVRGDFPILQREVNGRPLVYLDNAATAQKPAAVIDTVRRYYETFNANVHRGVHRLSVEATEAYERARAEVARFLGAERPEEIVFVRSATEAINLPGEVQSKVAAVEGVTEARVELVWDPPWTPERMSEAARLEAGLM